MSEMGFKGKPTYISPSTIMGFTEAKLYISKTSDSPPPTNEQLTTDLIIIETPHAIKLTPPGEDLHKLIETEMRTDFSTVNSAYLQNNLEQAIVEGLEIAETFELFIDNSSAQATIKNSIFEDIIKELDEKKQIIGDPLTSALACIIARSTRKPITIESINLEPEDKTFKATYKIHESQG